MKNYNNEIWRDIKNFEWLYQVSNLGRVKRLIAWNGHEYIKKENIIKNFLVNGYYQNYLSVNGKTYIFKTHRLVAIAFIDNINNLPEVNHKDENTINNDAINLEWCTRKYNNNYGNRLLKSTIKHWKKVEQYDLNMNLIKVWNNIIEASKIYKTHHIGECCIGKRKSTKGFIWRYANEL